MMNDPKAAAARLAELSHQIEDALRTTFRPEFLNRIDEVITFNALRIADIEPIVDLQLKDVRKRLEDRRITLDITPAVREHLAIDGYDPVFGARPLKRLIQREVVDRIAEKLVRGELHDKSHVLFDVDDEGEYTCRIEEALDFDHLLE
jgi:ATP-dependent Clp protease ATP-binding subunit ClpB